MTGSISALANRKTLEDEAKFSEEVGFVVHRVLVLIVVGQIVFGSAGNASPITRRGRNRVQAGERVTIND